MEVKKIFILGINILFLLIWIGLIGITIWPITGLYGSSPVWWSGNSAVDATKYAGWGAAVGMIGMIIQIAILQHRSKISKKWSFGILSVTVISSIILTGLCLPYFIIPAQIGTNAETAFVNTWGANWTSLITPPSQGPWLTTPYSLIQTYSALPYSTSAFSETQNIVYYNNSMDSFKCDAYIPNGPGPFPILIEIHGGGWLGGDKDGTIEYQKEYFAAAGYAVFSIQYGSMAEANMSRQYSMTEIFANIAEFSDWLAEPQIQTQYKTNISETFVTGLSAGGHLSALIGVARFNVSAWNPAVNLLGAIDFYGITDLRHWAVVSPQWFNDTGLFNASVLTIPTFWINIAQ